MKEQDIKNFDIIKGIVNNHMGYDDEGLAFFNREIDTPFIDEEYKKIIGEDRRAVYDISEGSISDIFDESSRKVYRLFSNLFHSFACSTCARDYGVRVITAKEVMDNTLVVGKNTIKIKKFLEQTYAEKKQVWDRDTGGQVPNTEKNINEYIIKAFEQIGEIKVGKKNNLKLIVSLNFADFMMSSTSESWTSCYDLQKGYYWYGVPGLIGDKDRALLYICDGTKKEWNGIIVDKMISRTWIFLTDKNKKGITKFYPNDNYKAKEIIEITNDKSYIDLRNGERHKGKNRIYVPFFKNALACTTSNDVSSLEDYDKETLTGVWKLGNSGGVQAFSKTKRSKINFSSWPEISLPALMSSKSDYSSRLITGTCEICGDTLYNSTFNKVDGKKICHECNNNLVARCGKCGKVHLKENLVKVGGTYFCKDCAPIPFVCHICGENKTNGKTIDEKKVCNTCAERLPHCLKCKAKHLPDKLFVIHDVDSHKRKHRCVTCALQDFADFSECPSCNELWPADRIVYNGTCKNCHDKLPKKE